MKAYSFTSHPERGWSVVTPVGAIIVEPGQQVTIVVSERWEADRMLRGHEKSHGQEGGHGQEDR